MTSAEDASQPLIFLSYATPDRDRVMRFYDWLEGQGQNVWLDQKRILPGQDWDLAINLAIDRAALVIVFVSANSIQRRGYMQREIRRALDRRLEQLSDDIFLIPVLLDDVELPRELRKIQAVPASAADCFDRLMRALNLQLARLGHEQEKIQRAAQVEWRRRRTVEKVPGNPNYECDFETLEFSSSRYPGVREVGHHLSAKLMESVHQVRLHGFLVQHDDPEFDGLSSIEAGFSDPQFRGKFISVHGSASTYFTGAAHGNIEFVTAVFLLDPLIYVRDLRWIFLDPSTALSVLQQAVRQTLGEVNLSDDDDEPMHLSMDWVLQGTKDWPDFDTFVFGENALQFSFAPYRVAAYARGPQFADVDYRLIAEHLRPPFREALGLGQPAPSITLPG